MELIEAICYRSIKNLLDAGNLAGEGIRENDRSKRNAGLVRIGLWLAMRVFVWFLIVIICKTVHFKIDLCLTLLVVYGVAVWGYYRVVGQNTGADTMTTAPDDVDVEMARQEAMELDSDMTTLIYNVTRDVADTTPVIEPRDEYSVQTGADNHVYIEGTMAVYRFEIRCGREIDRPLFDMVLKEFETAINRQAKRFPALLVDGRGPIVYDLIPRGNYFSLEIVRYPSNSEQMEKISVRKRARIARQLKNADPNDPFFS